MTTTEAIARRIDAYVPKSLTTSQWELAAPAARELVRSAGPTSAEDAKCLLSSLCTFLASPSAWDRESAPDFAVLLRDAAIEAFRSEFAGPFRTARNHVGRLRSPQRALVGIRRVAEQPRPPKARASHADRRAHDMCAGRPVSTRAAVVSRATRSPIRASRLDRLAREARAGAEANAAARDTGTVAVDEAVLGAYLHAADCELRKGVVHATKPIPTTPSKPASGRQRLAIEHLRND